MYLAAVLIGIVAVVFAFKAATSRPKNRDGHLTCEGILTRNDLDLEEIFSKSFPGRDKDRLLHLWTAISEKMVIPPKKLRADDRVADLCPGSKWSAVNVRMEDLTDFVIKESGGREVPKDMKTISEVVNFLF